MNFRIVWLFKVLRNLTASYVYARTVGRDTAAITRAMAQLDNVLGQSPMSVGESREEGVRVLIVNPLTVYFEVHDDERTVVVTMVRYHRRDT